MKSLKAINQKNVNKLIVICGPTASGKTNIAHQFAKNNNAEIVNADSMQLYEQLPIITASPPSNLKEEIPYHLYNFLDASCHYSVARYTEIAAETIKQIAKRNCLPVLVGGSGMYINALINGLSYIPEISQQTRTQTKELQKSLGQEAFFNLLKQTDHRIANHLNAQDSQRVARAYEVYLQTGNSILSYQKNPIKPLPEFKIKVIFVLPERDFLYSMCDKRLMEMFQSGGIEEVEKLLNENRNITLSVTKALGVEEITNYLHGKISKEQALEIAQKRTRQYAKRQITWFKHQLQDKVTIDPLKETI